MSQERELNDKLKDEELSRLYAEASSLEPPEHLDAAILAEAHRAVHAHPVAAQPKRRWAMPLGLVASVLVMVMVGLQLPYMLQEPTPMQASAPASIAPQMDEPMAAPAPAKKMRSENFMADKAAGAAGNNIPAAPPEVAAQPAPVMAPPPAAKVIELREREARARVEIQAKEKKAAVSSEAALQPQAPAAAVAAPAPMLRALSKDESVAERPEDWLKRIEQLKQEGKQEEARKELEAFRKRYPDYPLPVGLK